MIQFGHEVRRRRLDLRLTLEQLAERTGLTSNYIGTIEKGLRDPSISSILAIARGLGAAAGELFGPTPKLTRQAIEMGKLFDLAESDVQSSLLMILRAIRLRRPSLPRPTPPPDDPSNADETTKTTRSAPPE